MVSFNYVHNIKFMGVEDILPKRGDAIASFLVQHKAHTPAAK
ncbi:hypothetical protein [Tumidithrix helvetica]